MAGNDLERGIGPFQQSGQRDAAGRVGRRVGGRRHTQRTKKPGEDLGRIDPCDWRVIGRLPLDEIARSLACPVLWHDGYTVGVEDIAQHPDYRGPHIVDLARDIAHNGELTPAILGLARNASFDPQDLKKVWHCVARYGTRA
ncbi:DUF3626 domain-containing protein [Rhodococcus sp. T7]|uniref:DUF3626 domain-containing protein n=1 Tax=Rhodococcus sp. T7 TaxID=627444 RepID=UPI001356C49F|nr:DUF3626 domain-containing protein [Rhodococcus sp. T7]KAF0957681.1 hypothetical protein MLGJGCBP_09513 [Rhodococcus sp. T7]KAF0963247.1 hypothetical protein MLGJGCBP_03553 [Rhodococcus sp. T7]